MSICQKLDQNMLQRCNNVSQNIMIASMLIDLIEKVYILILKYHLSPPVVQHLVQLNH